MKEFNNFTKVVVAQREKKAKNMSFLPRQERQSWKLWTGSEWHNHDSHCEAIIKTATILMMIMTELLAASRVAEGFRVPGTMQRAAPLVLHRNSVASNLHSHKEWKKGLQPPWSLIHPLYRENRAPVLDTQHHLHSLFDYRNTHTHMPLG